MDGGRIQAPTLRRWVWARPARNAAQIDHPQARTDQHKRVGTTTDKPKPARVNMNQRRTYTRTHRLPEDAFRAFQAGDARQWNRWRRTSPDTALDFRGLRGPDPAPGAWLRHFDLRGADLRGAQFSGGDLSFADLREAQLDDAVLDNAVLRGANCEGANFGKVSLNRADLGGANLSNARFKPGANLRHATLERADASGACLQHALLGRANLSEADFTGADLRHASLERADLSEARFDEADLRSVNLRRAILYRTSLKGTDLRKASVADAFLRSVALDDKTDQRSVFGLTRIWFTSAGHVDASLIAVNDIRAAALLSLLGERGAVASLVNAGSRTVVLILGRFGRRRMPVLRRLAQVLQANGKIPIIFDFPGPEDRELSDTVRLLATLSEFIVVDLSDPRSVPLELQAIIPGLMIPVVPIVQAGRTVFAMFQDLQRRYFWVLPPVAYADKNELAGHVEGAILTRVRRIQRQIGRRRKALQETPPTVASFGPAAKAGQLIDRIIK